MENDPRYRISVLVESEYLSEQSDPDGQRWVFAYHITIRNEGLVAVKLLTRHWIITDGDERIQEVHGEGVIGEQPNLLPGQVFEYTSGSILETRVGSMHGSYQMLAEDGHYFNVDIPAFTLAPPHTLH